MTKNSSLVITFAVAKRLGLCLVLYEEAVEGGSPRGVSANAIEGVEPPLELVITRDISGSECRL
jgi:hypothetical protein